MSLGDRTSSDDQEQQQQQPRTESPFFQLSSPHDQDDESVKLFIGQVRRSPALCLTVYCDQIPKNLDEDILQPFFEEFGPILEFSVIRDKTTKFHRGLESVETLLNFP
jgi:RNA recognition motif-containing protein